MLNNRKKVDCAVRVKGYARDSHFVVFCFVLVPVNVTHIPQDHSSEERRKFYDWRNSSGSTLAKECTVIHQGAISIRKTVLPGMAIPMLKIRRPNGRLIFNMEIAIRR